MNFIQCMNVTVYEKSSKRYKDTISPLPLCSGLYFWAVLRSITSWEIDGETMETLSDFIFWGSKITAYGDCSHEIKRRLLLGRKVMTNLDSIFKSRDITLPANVCLVKAMVFPVVMYGCESWTVKKVEHRRIDAFELWCWRRLLRVPWTARDPTSPFWRRSALGCRGPAPADPGYSKRGCVGEGQDTIASIRY